MRIQPGKDIDGNIIYINWDKSKTIKHGLATGKHYATYNDKSCTEFHFWLKRKEIINQYHLVPTVNI